MTLLIYAIDSQFAASTGSNVNSSPGQSKFDYPPTSSKDLVIESQPGDPSPYIFSPGDTYTLSFGGNGGATIENATVIRSDEINYDGDAGHAVVFEGLDTNGELVQVVWTPEFDLETWYFNNFSGGQPPEFYNTDQSGATTYQAVCFAEHVLISTPDGPRAAGDLRPGDKVQTLNNGVQAVTWITERRQRGWGGNAPVHFSPQTIGNTRDLWLSQQHRVLVDHEKAVPEYGQSRVLVPAVSFVNGSTIRIAPRNWITYVHFTLERHDVVWAEGAPCETLYMGEMARQALCLRTLDPAVVETLGMLGAGPGVDPAYPLLKVREGHRLLSAIRGDMGTTPPVNLLRRGRSRACPYRVKCDPWTDDMPGLPAYARISDKAEPALSLHDI